MDSQQYSDDVISLQFDAPWSTQFSCVHQFCYIIEPSVSGITAAVNTKPQMQGGLAVLAREGTPDRRSVFSECHRSWIFIMSLSSNHENHSARFKTAADLDLPGVF